MNIFHEMSVFCFFIGHFTKSKGGIQTELFQSVESNSFLIECKDLTPQVQCYVCAPLWISNLEDNKEQDQDFHQQLFGNYPKGKLQNRI